MNLEPIIDALYGAAVETGDWSQPLDLIVRTFDAESGALMLVDAANRDSQLLLGAGVVADPRVQQDYAAYYIDHDPGPRMFVGLRPGQAASTSRVWSMADRVGSEFYNDFFLRLGLKDTLGSPIFAEPDRAGTLAIQSGGQDFDDDAVAAFERLTPHLRRAFQLQRRLAGADQQRIALGDAMARRGEGAMLVNSSGRLVFANRVAEAVIGRQDGLGLGHDGRLELRDALAQAKLDVLLAGILLADRSDAGGAVMVPRAALAQPYNLLISPTPSPSPGAGRHALIILRDPDQTPEGLAVFAQRFGLTPAETRLFDAVLHGEALASYCRRTGVSANTGKFHMAALFAKTGVNSQIALARLAWDSLA